MCARTGSEWYECAVGTVEWEEGRGRGTGQRCSVSFSRSMKSHPSFSQSELSHISLLCNNSTNSFYFSLQNDHDIQEKKIIFLTASQKLVFLCENYIKVGRWERRVSSDSCDAGGGLVLLKLRGVTWLTR